MHQFLNEQPLAKLVFDEGIINWSPDGQLSFEVKRAVTKANLLEFVRRKNPQQMFKDHHGEAYAKAGCGLLAAFLLSAPEVE